MKASEREKFRLRLEGMRDELLQQGDVAIEPGSTGPSEKPDEDEAPYTEMNQVIASNRNRERAVRLRQIAAAMARLREDPEDFGVCEACDEPIASKRLELMPWARLCIPCQGRVEADLPRGRKHVTDYG